MDVVTDLKPAEAQHGLLEALVLLPSIPDLSREAKFRAAFAMLDIDLSGVLELCELRTLVGKMAAGYNS